MIFKMAASVFLMVFAGVSIVTQPHSNLPEPSGGSSANPLQEQDKVERNSSRFMKQKLNHAKDIVGGLANEDFELIGESAQALMLLSHEADWKVITTKEYLKMSNEFRTSAARLRSASESKNLDGSTLAYFEVTLSCVRCHKYIRKHGEK